MRRFEVVCVGSAVVDNFFTIDTSLNAMRSGDKYLTNTVETHSGGGATNAGAALTTFGIRTAVITKVGDDQAGTFIEQQLKEHNLPNLCKNKSSRSTDTSAIIYSTKDRDRIIFNHKGATLTLRKKDFPVSTFKTKWFYLASITKETISTAKWLAKYAQRNEIPLLFNPSLYVARLGKYKLRPFLKAAHILVLNKQEAKALLKTRSNDDHKLLKEIKSLGPQKVVITNGNKTFHAFDGETFYSVTPPNVNIISTTGAGDSFNGALLASLLKKESFPSALIIAQANASSVITKRGAKHGLLSFAQAKKLVRKKKIKVKQHAAS